mmetsp:Transcript_12838/g.19472  ORF Transcript_12838/g.19472 Transcript_12838/m.19472 type:complete len:298 (+) Transcript_12838:310-1203(+)
MKWLTTILAIGSRINSVRNPNTGRLIQVGGKTFTTLMKQNGGFIMHNSNLFPINFGNNCTAYNSNLGDHQILSDDDNETAEDFFEVQPNVTFKKTDILFVHKPSHLLSVPGVGPLKADSLATRVCKYYPNAKICHRLDRDTSGVMVFGLTKDSHRHVSKLFEVKLARKEYVCLVDGHVKSNEGRINLPIGKMKTEEGFNRWVIGGEKSRDAITEYTVDARLHASDGHAYSRVIVRPLTGRGQQIRLHMKALGHPLLGDTLHAPANVAFATPRLCLHAQSLSLEIGGKVCCAGVISPF